MMGPWEKCMVLTMEKAILLGLAQYSFIVILSMLQNI